MGVSINYPFRQVNPKRVILMDGGVVDVGNRRTDCHISLMSMGVSTIFAQLNGRLAHGRRLLFINDALAPLLLPDTDIHMDRRVLFTGIAALFFADARPARARNTPCSGSKGGVSHCAGSVFVCRNGSTSQSKRICSTEGEGPPAAGAGGVARPQKSGSRRALRRLKRSS
jgi:hypothetical protein